jgi:hypothetical protein
MSDKNVSIKHVIELKKQICDRLYCDAVHPDKLVVGDLYIVGKRSLEYILNTNHEGDMDQSYIYKPLLFLKMPRWSNNNNNNPYAFMYKNVKYYFDHRFSHYYEIYKYNRESIEALMSYDVLKNKRWKVY